MSYVKIGVGGPVGSGKTALIERLTREMSKEYSICVVTNDIYTKEDAEFLTKNSCLPADRIVGVETGGCPHTAIREDCSMNLEAVDEMAAATIYPPHSPLTLQTLLSMLSTLHRVKRYQEKAALA